MIKKGNINNLRETLLLVNFLLFWFIHGLRVAGVAALQLALSEPNLHTVVDRNRPAVHGAFHLAGLLHLDNFGGHGLAVGLDGGEVHGLLNDLTLLPRHGFTFLLASPNLISVLINVPVSDAVVLGDSLALRHLLVVLHRVILLLAVLVREVLVRHVALLALGRPDLGGTFSPPDSVTLNLGGILTDPFRLGNTVFLEFGVAALGSGGGVLYNIPEGDICAEVFLQSTFANQGQGKETKSKRKKIEGRHG